MVEAPSSRRFPNIRSVCFCATRDSCGGTEAFFRPGGRPAVRLADGRLIGFGGLFDITRALTATLFVGIGERDLWGQGLGTEATRLICEYGFFFRSLYNIKVEINGYNRRAIRVYQRLGFQPVGRVRGAIPLNGKRYDQVIMDLLRSELDLKHVAEFRDLAGEGDCPA